ncbi:hypothetical protein Q5P01_019129 [Channa striata]|uniref:Uncharacterized protein n=1 Tax=Channa striata TaxID=64152 RepID=A0AA88M0X7_CHASR|nr:hypothetical protein Q5P01_019129 [Channa striata]
MLDEVLGKCTNKGEVRTVTSYKSVVSLHTAVIQSDSGKCPDFNTLENRDDFPQRSQRAALAGKIPLSD